jgi:integrase
MPAIGLGPPPHTQGYSGKEHEERHDLPNVGGHFSSILSHSRVVLNVRLLELGASLSEVQAGLGHATITMTSRYLGTTDAGLQKAFARLDEARRADPSV